MMTTFSNFYTYFMLNFHDMFFHICTFELVDDNFFMLYTPKVYRIYTDRANSIEH